MKTLPALAAKSLAITAVRRLQKGPKRPSWSFRFEFVVELMKQSWIALEGASPAEMRRSFESVPKPRTALRKVTRTPWSAGSLSGTLFEPQAADKDKDGIILYLHGGAYVVGSSNSHADMLARLCTAAGMRCLCIDYRLAPEHPYPAQLEDAKAAYRALLAHGEAPERMVLCGESAGGNLVLSLLIALRDAGEPLPAAAAVISPWVDLESLRASIRHNAQYDYGTYDMLMRFARMFAGDIPLADPRISPLHADLGGLPPLFVQYGEAEILADECRELARRGADAGIDVTVDPLAEMPHASLFFAAFAPLAQESIQRVAAYVRERI